MTESLSYMVTVTDDGSWLHAPGSDFVFAFISKEWDSETQKQMTEAFKKALQLTTIIKAAVKKTAGQDVVNGLYLLDQPAMTEAMNSIDGMGMTGADQKHDQGSGTAVSITQEFFGAVLAGLSGDVAPMLQYLTQEMGNLQAQIKESTVTSSFGTVMGLISLMPELNVPVTTFEYVYSSSTTAEWIVQVNCGSVQHYSYDYSYTVVDYSYGPGEILAHKK
jgi:hypothetical protein